MRDDDGGVTEYRATVSVGVTYASLCALTRAYSSKPAVAEAMCVTLRVAELADAHGAELAKRVALKAYVLQARAQSGKAFTTSEAAILIKLADEL